MNNVKTAALLTFLGMLFVGFGYLIGGAQGGLFALGFAVLFNFGMYFFSDRIALAAAKAKPIAANELPGEPLPWGYALFVGRMGKTPGSISYAPENAFSFGFARNVYSVEVGDGLELFVTPAGTEAAAAELAGRFMDGFRNYGSDEGQFVKDRYQGTYARAITAGPWVVGFLRATDTDQALTALDELANVVADMPLPAVTEESTDTDTIEEDYGSDEY